MRLIDLPSYRDFFSISNRILINFGIDFDIDILLDEEGSSRASIWCMVHLCSSKTGQMAKDDMRWSEEDSRHHRNCRRRGGDKLSIKPLGSRTNLCGKVCTYICSHFTGSGSMWLSIAFQRKTPDSLLVLYPTAIVPKLSPSLWVLIMIVYFKHNLLTAYSV